MKRGASTRSTAASCRPFTNPASYGPASPPDVRVNSSVLSVFWPKSESPPFLVNVVSQLRLNMVTT